MARTGQLYLHEAMEYVVLRAGRPLPSGRIAAEINDQALFTRARAGSAPLQWWQIEIEARKFPMKFRLEGRDVCLAARSTRGEPRIAMTRSG
ncbi:hypothetical protein [Mangrovicoccus algicola]|uniref:Uncharacterized protein n=1 Tax=Mangrovicoccus algicola TaxID=2771008 RepID=A0A8J6Z936_9RHOB|nr:hypothetical protein [Mangrovicoccus algicola]MBE3638510.1 hypothetical protein [Mangrovicoccus algicola]